MAGSSLGSLLVSLGLDASEYTQGLTRAEFQAKKFSDGAVKGFKAAAAGTTAIVAGLTAAGYALERAVNGVANYKQISEQIGDTAQNISGLQEAADRSGTALESIVGSSIRLTKVLEGQLKSTEGAGAALEALGINAEKFKQQAPVERLQALADAAAKFKDTPSKTSALEQFFGKGVRDVLPFLNDLAEVGSKNSRFTQQQIEDADRLKKSYDSLTGQIRDTSRLLASDFVPAMDGVIKKFKEGYTEGGLFKGLMLGLGQAFVEAAGGVEKANLKSKLIEIDKQIENTKNKMEGRSFFPSGFLNQDAEGLKKRLAQLEQMRAHTVAMLASTEPKKPITADVKKEEEVPFDEDKLKRAAALDKRLQELAKLTADSQISLSKDTETQALQILDMFNQEGLYSIAGYYESRKAIIQKGLADELQAINQKISAEKAAAADAAKDKEYDKENAALLAIQKLLEQKSQLQRKVAGEFQIDSIKQRQEEEKFADQLKEVNIQLLELTGNTYAATQARNALANQDLRKRLTASGNTTGLKALSDLEQGTSARAQFNDELQRQTDLTTRLGIEEERIQNSQRVGAIGEIEALKRTGDARAKAVTDLEKIVVKLEEVARVSQNPALILQAEQARAALEKLRLETDLLGQKFDTIFSDSFSSAFADFVDGTKSAKDAFTDFARSVSKQITQLVAQDIAKGLLKTLGGDSGGGGASGIGAFFAKLFGGSLGSGGVSAAFQGVGAVPYATGTSWVPHDMLAYVHRGERITPANQNTGGGGGGNVYMTVVTRDASSFNSSRGQVAANASSALAVGRRNL